MNYLNSPIDWESNDSTFFFNPAENIFLSKNFPNLNAHIWVASSGTTNRPRLIALSKNAFLTSAKSVNEHLQITSNDIWILALPLFHVGGLSIFARTHLSQSKIVSGIGTKWDPSFFVSQAIESGATLAALVPTQLFDLVSSKIASPPLLRALVIGGSNLDPDLYFQARSLGWPCLPSYGLTEACSQVATAELSSLNETVLPELKILPHLSVDISPKSEVIISGKSLFTFSSDFGFYRGKGYPTEDLGELSNGALALNGRSSDMIKILGEKIYLGELESRISKKLASPSFLATLPDPRRGIKLVLCLSEATVGDFQSVTNLLEAVLKPYERISNTVFVKSFPKTSLGKIKRNELNQTISKLI